MSDERGRVRKNCLEAREPAMVGILFAVSNVVLDQYRDAVKQPAHLRRPSLPIRRRRLRRRVRISDDNAVRARSRFVDLRDRFRQASTWALEAFGRTAPSDG
jgi:hypothetical protein